VGTCGRQVGSRKGGMRVNMVDVLASICENRRVKPVEIVLRRRQGGRRRMMGGGTLTKIYCKYICEYHNVSPCAAIIY
jgi:hypothetical protein